MPSWLKSLRRLRLPLRLPRLPPRLPLHPRSPALPKVVQAVVLVELHPHQLLHVPFLLATQKSSLSDAPRERECIIVTSVNTIVDLDFL